MDKDNSSSIINLTNKINRKYFVQKKKNRKLKKLVITEKIFVAISLKR
jgi:hypothetical protein